MPSSTLRPDLVLCNARAVTLDERRPAAELVAVEGSRIAWVGANEDLPSLVGRHTRVIDCQGQTLAPGFIDAHCHVMAYASSLLAVDCSPSAASSIGDVKYALQERARSTPQGYWIRAAGYDEFALKEKRHLSRRDLDEAAPRHPVRLNHRSGHACVLNSLALARVGISADTPDPAGGVIERDWDTGEPTGLLLEMDDYLGSLIPPLSDDELRRGVQLASQQLVAWGVTSVQDATASNSIQRWEAFRRLKAEEDFGPRVTMMVGAGYLDAFLAQGLRFGSGDGSLNLGAVKIMVTTTTGTLRPSPEELRRAVLQARGAGFQVAIHAVEAEAVDAAAHVLVEAQRAWPRAQARGRDRIEHCAECPPAVLARLAGAGIVVVTQPGFVYYSGRRYLSQVAPDVQPWLYRTSSFLKAGLRLAASSDAPVIKPNPLVGLYAAVTRRAETGEVVGTSEGVSPAEAMRMYTVGGAYAAFQEADKGTIEVGKLADLVLLDQDPTRVEAAQVLETKVMLTILGGQVVWQA